MLAGPIGPEESWLAGNGRWGRDAECHGCHHAELTFWASLVDCNDRFLVGGVDSLKRLSFLALHPLAIDVQAERLLVGDGGGLNLLC